MTQPSHGVATEHQATNDVLRMLADEVNALTARLSKPNITTTTKLLSNGSVVRLKITETPIYDGENHRAKESN